jgi:small conductance mechanosensitive channel
MLVLAPESTTAKVVWLAVIGGLGSAALLLTVLLLPPRIEAFLRWLDKYVPGDFSALHHPASRVLIFLLSGVILFAAGVSVAYVAELNISGILTTFEDFGKNVGTWSAEHLVRIGLIILGAFAATRVVRVVIPRMLQRAILRRDAEGTVITELEKREKTLENVVIGAINSTLALIAFFIVLTELGINVGPLLAGAGIAGIAIGFGAQTLIRDLIAGAFVIMEDQYRVGDVVNIAGVGGLVEDINLRRTVLRDLDFIVHVIPNGEVRVASNYTKEKSRVNLNISVAYKEDLDRCIAILNKIGQEMKDDPYWGELMNEPIKVLRIDHFGDSGIDIKVLGETKPIRQWDVAGEYRRRVKRTFDEEGIEIPFPHRTLYWGKGEKTIVVQHEGDGRSFEQSPPDQPHGGVEAKAGHASVPSQEEHDDI